jgi:prophage antirepressor-like protein
VRRHPHIDQFSTIVDLKGRDGKVRRHRVYNPIGLQLIVLKSHQPKVEEYQVALAKLVWDYSRQTSLRQTDEGGGTATSTPLQPFRYDAIEMSEACYINGDPHFTRRAIGQWLEYNYPQKAVDKILERNPHINQFSVAVNLTATDGKTYEYRVFNPIGFQLIVFESAQPKAKKYKVAVAKLVWAYMKGELKLKDDRGSEDLGYREWAERMERSVEKFSQAVNRLADVMERLTQTFGPTVKPLPQESASRRQVVDVPPHMAVSLQRVAKRARGVANKIMKLEAYRSGLIQSLLDSTDPYYSYKQICQIVKRETGESFSTGTLSHFFRLYKKGLL